MAKGKSAPRAGLKGVMLAKGEYVALGVSGLALGMLLLWGVSRWSDAKDPKKVSDELDQKAKAVYARIKDQSPPTPEEVPDLPDWVKKPYKFVTAPVGDFPLTGPQFDPIAKPDTKRERPLVLPVGRYQIDLVRGAMMGFDVQMDQQGNPEKMGMIVSRASGPQSAKAKEELGKRITNQVQGRRPPPPMPKAPVVEGGGADPGRGFDTTAQRVEKAVEYVDINEVGRALTEGKKEPASAVVPLRMIVLYAEVPYKKQVEELRRALRLPDYLTAQRWGPVYDGYEVQRRISRVVPGGKPVVVQDWPAPPDDKKPNYEYTEKYADLVYRRRFEDNVDDGYLSYFIRPEMALALPLPKLVLGAYPPLKLEATNATIAALKKAQLPPETLNAVQERFQKRPPKDDLFRPQSAAQTGAIDFMPGDEGGRPRPKGPGGLAPVGPPGKAAVPPKLGEKGNQEVAPPVEIDHLLLRFVDVDVRPGYTYEYRVRLRMLNPNEGQPVDAVANPSFAKEKLLLSPWTTIEDAVTLPPEAFQYAVDPAAYRARVDKEHPPKGEDKPVHDRLQAKDNQVVVQQVAWREEVRTDAGGKREPVGTWVVADLPVGRGEFVGRKQYVKLPVWSSEYGRYALREVPDKISLPRGKEVAQPKGWLLDFSADKSILVDFEGGKAVTPRPGGNKITEDAAVEMLIVRPDGSLVVRKSEADDKDEANQGFRPRVVSEWEKWVQGIEKLRAAETDKKEFDRKDGGKN